MNGCERGVRRQGWAVYERNADKRVCLGFHLLDEHLWGVSKIWSAGLWKELWDFRFNTELCGRSDFDTSLEVSLV